MWRELEKTAIEMDIDLFYFWKLTPKQFNKYIEVWEEKQKNKIKENDQLNWLLGKYICYAYNDPKHYPKEPFTNSSATNTSTIMTDDDMEKIARHNTLKLGGKLNDS